MKLSIQYWAMPSMPKALRWLLAGCLQLAVGIAYGEIEYNCFEIVPGTLPHIACSKNKAVDFAIDSVGDNGWKVTVHHTRGWGYVELAKSGDVVNDAMFGNDCYSVDAGPTETFTFAFRWWCKITETTTAYCYGWVTLGTKNGALTIIDNAIANQENEAIVGYGDGDSEALMPRPDISVWQAIDRGEFMELRSGCIPSKTEGLVSIPNEIGGKPVRVIGSGAFAGCSRVTNVCIPDSVREIGNGAFDGCMELKTVSLPNGLEKILNYAFKDCFKLSSLTIPTTVSLIEPYAFTKDSSLVVHLPKSEAGRIVRMLCTDKNDDWIEPTVTFAEDPTAAEALAGNFAWPFYFSGDRLLIGNINRKTAFPPGLAGAVEIPTTLAGMPVYGIGKCAFRECEQITSVRISNGIRFVGELSFLSCRGLASVEIPVSVTDFRSTAFQDCGKIITATIPGGENSIRHYLRGADGLRHLAVAEGSAFVGENQFAGLDDLLTVTLPSSLRLIRMRAFADCGCLVQVGMPDQSVLVSIGARAFEGCRSLRVFILPGGLVGVGEDAFSQCDSLRVLRIPGSLSYIGDRAFRYLGGLKTLVIDEGVYGIGEEAFAGCGQLEKIVFPSTLQLIDRWAFGDCRGLRTLELPEGLLMLDEGAFVNSHPKEIHVPSSLAYVGYRAFETDAETAVRVSSGDVERVSGLLAGADIRFERGQIVEEGHLTDLEKSELAKRLVSEAFTPTFMQDFSTLSPGVEVVICLPDAQPGLMYAIGVSATVEGLSQALRSAQRKAATSDGVEIIISKPAGDSAFFAIAVSEPP